MKNLEQETSSKLLSQKSINYFLLSGKVVCPCVFKKARGRLFAKCRLKTRTHASSFAYIDIYGFGEIANMMNLTCQLGNVVLIEAHLTNKIYVTKKGIKKAKVYFLIDNIETLVVNQKSKSTTDLEGELEILDELDPWGYAGDSFGIKD